MITNPNVKINLGLNILRKREDGFHDLETLFVPYFDIHDTLEIVVGDDYSRTSAALFGKYAPEMIAQGISEDAKVLQMISFIAPVLENIKDEAEREAVAQQFEDAVRNLVK